MFAFPLVEKLIFHMQAQRVFATPVVQSVKKFAQLPPRHLNEAKLNTVDKKVCSLVWRSGNKIDITLQDRTSNVTFPLNLRKDAGKFLSCSRDGGITKFTDFENPTTELKVGSDRGVLYFSLKSDEGTITTGLSASDAAIATSLIRFAENKRIRSSF